MGFFPSDWDDEEQDDFSGNVEELVREFESNKDATFSPRELLEIFRYYSYNQLMANDGSKGFMLMKTVLEQGIDQFPYIPVFAIHMAEVLMREKNYRMARRYIAKAREYSAFEPALFMVDAAIYGLEGRKEKAMELLKEAMELAGEDEQAMEDFLELLIHYGQFELALPVLDKCLDLGGDIHYIVEKWLGQTQDKNHVRALLPMLERLVDKDPYAEEAWYLLANACADLEDYTRAIEAFDFAVTINENFIEAWLGYMEALYEHEDYNSFIMHYREQSERFHKGAFDELKGLLAWSHYETGKVKEARTLYHEVLKSTMNRNMPKPFPIWKKHGNLIHWKLTTALCWQRHILAPIWPINGNLCMRFYLMIFQMRKRFGLTGVLHCMRRASLTGHWKLHRPE
jgi:tetratricopeptide (TPR) repeat protein